MPEESALRPETGPKPATVPSASTDITEPGTYAVTLDSLIAERTSEVTEAETMTTMSTPRFREFSIPTQVTSPPWRTQSNTAGMVRAEQSMVAMVPRGRTCDRSAARPPPITYE